jgi:hypothetical protein
VQPRTPAPATVQRLRGLKTITIKSKTQQPAEGKSGTVEDANRAYRRKLLALLDSIPDEKGDEG